MNGITSELKQTRSVVTTSAGLVATGHPLSAEAGAAILSAGGNAVDAAATAIFATWVTEPASCGLGGLGRGIVYDSSRREVRVLSSTGGVPSSARADMFELQEGLDPWGRWRKVKNDANMIGPLSPMVPGMLAGVCEVLERSGSMPLDRLLAPAIRLAEEGIAVDGYTTLQIAANLARMREFPETATIFMPEGQPLRPEAMHQQGSKLIQRDLANTLSMIAHEGPSAFYEGEIGARIASHLQQQGGILSAHDLSAYEPEYAPPARTGSYRDCELVWSDGFFANLVLNVLEHFDMAAIEPGTAEYYHLLIEATRHSFATLLTYLADPLVHPSPLAALWSKRYAAQVAGRIDKERASDRIDPVNPWPTETLLTGQDAPNDLPPHRNSLVDPGTSQVVVADASGNVATFNVTHSGPFGSMVTVPGTGVLLNGAMTSMDPVPGKPHSIHPKRRHLGFSAPVLAMRNGEPAFAFSASGGRSVITCQVQMVCGMVDYGLSPQEAAEFPRMHCELEGVRLDRRVDESEVRRLRELGHDVNLVEETFYAPYFARPVCIGIDPNGAALRSGISHVHRVAAVGLPGASKFRLGRLRL